jgi:hypothetical protein
MNKIKNIFWLTLACAFMVFFLYKVARRALTDHLLKNNANYAKAVIIDEKNYMPNQDVKPQFTYSYEFKFDGKKYTGNSHDTTVKIGDTIKVKFYKDLPSLNVPLYHKE